MKNTNTVKTIKIANKTLIEKRDFNFGFCYCTGITWLGVTEDGQLDIVSMFKEIRDRFEKYEDIETAYAILYNLYSGFEEKLPPMIKHYREQFGAEFYEMTDKQIEQFCKDVVSKKFKWNKGDKKIKTSDKQKNMIIREIMRTGWVHARNFFACTDLKWPDFILTVMGLSKTCIPFLSATFGDCQNPTIVPILYFFTYLMHWIMGREKYIEELARFGENHHITTFLIRCNGSSFRFDEKRLFSRALWDDVFYFAHKTIVLNLQNYHTDFLNYCLNKNWIHPKFILMSNSCLKFHRKNVSTDILVLDLENEPHELINVNVTDHRGSRERAMYEVANILIISSIQNGIMEDFRIYYRKHIDLVRQKIINKLGDKAFPIESPKEVLTISNDALAIPDMTQMTANDTKTEETKEVNSPVIINNPLEDQVIRIVFEPVNVQDEYDIKTFEASDIKEMERNIIYHEITTQLEVHHADEQNIEMLEVPKKMKIAPSYVPSEIKPEKKIVVTKIEKQKQTNNISEKLLMNKSVDNINPGKEENEVNNTRIKEMVNGFCKKIMTVPEWLHGPDEEISTLKGNLKIEMNKTSYTGMAVNIRAMVDWALGKSFKNKHKDRIYKIHFPNLQMPNHTKTMDIYKTICSFCHGEKCTKGVIADILEGLNTNMFPLRMNKRDHLSEQEIKKEQTDKFLSYVLRDKQIKVVNYYRINLAINELSFDLFLIKNKSLISKGMVKLLVKEGIITWRQTGFINSDLDVLKLMILYQDNSNVNQTEARLIRSALKKKLIGKNTIIGNDIFKLAKNSDWEFTEGQVLCCKLNYKKMHSWNLKFKCELLRVRHERMQIWSFLNEYEKEELVRKHLSFTLTYDIITLSGFKLEGFSRLIDESINLGIKTEDFFNRIRENGDLEKYF